MELHIHWWLVGGPNKGARDTWMAFSEIEMKYEERWLPWLSTYIEQLLSTGVLQAAKIDLAPPSPDVVASVRQLSMERGEEAPKEAEVFLRAAMNYLASAPAT